MKIRRSNPTLVQLPDRLFERAADGQNGGDNRKYELLSNLLGVQVK
jgi:hypothetical protein